MSKYLALITIAVTMHGDSDSEIEDVIQDEFDFTPPEGAEVLDLAITVKPHQDEENGWDGEEPDEVEEISFDELQHSPGLQ